MLMRESASRLRPGAYLIGASPDAAQLPYPELRAAVSALIKSVEHA